jgi:hypothetical protein
MPTDKQPLIDLIEQHRDALVDAVCKRLQKLQGSHYEFIDYECHLEREQTFLTAILDGLRDPQFLPFLEFVDQLTEQRLKEGYTLEEFQEAFNVVEDSVWEILVAHQPCSQALVEMLAMMAHLFQAAKDHLARVYFHKVVYAERELDELRKKFRVYRKVTQV